ncbi:DUF6220 domain-containing protein [Sinorhizobium sp. NFACC03]|uniref:DUF6220 domain-containing protein n=1 Tax=Sinorhizobium sp. NFACC03 TaxID=1566295 RepID=UPI00088FB7D1|nr:DUF6220 domain-containing protein [Sinorhizobium sp. NFACC03]SDA61993.1 hypothetical protein SAMN03159448_01791 [Sinorhizobium sp. NFACC03]
MDEIHDTLADLDAGTPVWFTFAACLLPVGILGQFLSAGLALFSDISLWELHAILGGGLSLPVITLLIGSLIVARLRGFGWWAGLMFGLYVGQVMLAAGSTPPLLWLHPFNGTLLFGAASILLFKVARRVAAGRVRTH